MTSPFNQSNFFLPNDTPTVETGYNREIDPKVFSFALKVMIGAIGFGLLVGFGHWLLYGPARPEPRRYVSPVEVVPIIPREDKATTN